MATTILVVDDKANTRQLLYEYLTEQGFKVISATNGQEAIYSARHHHPDLILLDIMMPKMDGYQFLRQYRQESQIPVIIITAREEETDVILGLELGADDYIVKPFRLRELVARIHAILRREERASNNEKPLTVGDLYLDPISHTVTIKNKPISLTPIEFDLLMTFMRSPGQVFTRTQLIEHLMDSGFSGLDVTLNVHIRNLRTKIEANPSQPQYIETVFGVGYRLAKPN